MSIVSCQVRSNSCTARIIQIEDEAAPQSLTQSMCDNNWDRKKKKKKLCGDYEHTTYRNFGLFDKFVG